MRVRGLKSGLCGNLTNGNLVAPYAGAWIEIYIAGNVSFNMELSHPMRVRGLKLTQKLF